MNIAEGSGTESIKDQIRFLENSRKSLHETLVALLIAEKIYQINIVEVKLELDEVGKLLNGYINFKKKNLKS